MGTGIVAAALIAARFTTIQTDDAIRDAACTIVATAKVDEVERPFDVQVEGKRCKIEPRADDAITLSVTVAPRDYGLREVVVELDAPEGFADDDARNTVTQLGRVLKARVAATPVQAIVRRREKIVYANKGLHDVGIGFVGLGSALVVAGLVVLIGTLAGAAGQSAGCSVNNFVNDPLNDKSCKPDTTAGVGIASGFLAGGALFTIGGAVMITVGGRQVTVSF